MSLLDKLFGVTQFLRNGTPLPTRNRVNYKGAGVHVADNSADGTTDITFDGVASMPEWGPDESYSPGALVRHSGSAWIASSGADAGQEPGVHGAWEALGGGEIVGKLAADLANEGGEVGKIARLRGVTVPGIGGGDVELVEDEELEDDPVGGVFASGIANHFWVRPERTYRFEEEFLAHPSASASDNYEGLNRGAHDCGVKGLKFILRGGTYNVGGTLDLKGKYAWIEGVGRGRTILKASTAMDALVEVGGTGGVFSIGNLTLNGNLQASSAWKVSQNIDIQSRLYHAYIHGSPERQLDFQASAVSCSFWDLQVQGGKFGIYCDNTVYLSGAVFWRLRCNSATPAADGAAIYLNNPGTSSVIGIAFYEPIVEGCRGRAVVITGGHNIRWHGGHFEGNCREIPDGEGGYLDEADVLIGGGMSPLNMTMYNTTFSVTSASQVSQRRVRFTANLTRLNLVGVFINAGYVIDCGNYLNGSRVFMSGLPVTPTISQFTRNNWKVWPPRAGGKTWNPDEIPAGSSGAPTTVTVPGARMGDMARASFSLGLQGITLNAYVTADDEVTVIPFNPTGSPINLGSGTLYVQAENP